MSKIHRNIFLIGATDRNNYGDLLFPHIVENYLRHTVTFDYTVSNYAIRYSDLSLIGALKTNSYRKFLKDIKLKDNVNVIVIGGEVLGADWIKLYSFLNPIINFMLYKNLFEYRFLRRIVKFIIVPREKRTLPFLICKNELPEIKNVIYSGVGGTVPEQLQMSLSYDLFSVRSERDKRNLKQLKSVEVIPDSAIIMSDFWSISKLDILISQTLKEKLFDEYIFFQVNKEVGKSNVELIVKQLTDLYNLTGIPVILCPIGKAVGHEDHLALKAINEKLEIPHIYFNQPNIWDIMFLIAKSKLYIGTSLHGLITAMSYSVPYLGIVRPNMKIQKYLDDWAISELRHSVDIDEFVISAKIILETDLCAHLKLSAIKMKTLVQDFLSRTVKVIENE